MEIEKEEKLRREIERSNKRRNVLAREIVSLSKKLMIVLLRKRKKKILANGKSFFFLDKRKGTMVCLALLWNTEMHIVFCDRSR